MKKVILKPGKEKSLLNKHPWIFSGAILSSPSFENGEILPVFASNNQFVAQAYFHTKNSIAGRILSFAKEPVKETIHKRIIEALALRRRFFDPELTNAYRLINAEGDGLPGLIVDSYDGHLVLQVNTCGMERLKPLIVEALIELVRPKSIYEKSHSHAREQEGLATSMGSLWGKAPKEVDIIENGLRFTVSIHEGQKTGFFLDQREMRLLLSKFVFGKKVLNGFCYSGGFSLFALKGGALEVDSVDCSKEALKLAEKNTLLNAYSLERHRLIDEDMFSFLRSSSMNYDVVVLDPPAFAKKKSDINTACRGYKEINRLVMEKVPPSSLLLTCSCSYFVNEDLFQKVIFQAACEAKRQVSILGRHVQALDHPISIYHPEGEYLKSFLLAIS